MKEDSKFKRAFKAAASDLKKNWKTKTVVFAGVAVGGTAVLGASPIIIVGAAVGTFGTRAISAAYKAYKKGPEN